jgi:hypothetical protein
MREPAANEVFPEAGASVKVDELPSRTVLHLSSDDPEVLRGGQPRRYGSWSSRITSDLSVAEVPELSAWTRGMARLLLSHPCARVGC